METSYREGMGLGTNQMYPPLLAADQVPTQDFIRSWHMMLMSIFGQRNGEYRVLRAIFDGSYRINPAYYPSSQMSADVAVSNTKVGSPFQNRIDLVYNVINATVRRYMDSMSQPPRIEGVPEGFDLHEIELADKRAKFLEYIWEANNMTVKLMQAAYYQSLLDKAVFNVRPAPHLKHKIKIELAVPDYYFPITRGDDWSHPIGIIYGFRTFENADYMRNPMTFNGNPIFNTVIEYWDANWFMRIEPNRAPIIIPHGLGFIPWYEIHNLPIPHRFRGQGDADQAVGLNEYLNTLMSAVGDMIAYAANPIAVVRGTKVGGTNLPFEARAVWELERDAQVGFLQWTGAPPTYEAQVLRTIQAIEDVTGVSSPAFGREIPSGTSGSAVRSLLAGFNTRLGTKQQLFGESLVRMNAGILKMAEKMFPEEEFRVVGENTIPGRDLGKQRDYVLKPKEFKGWYKNRVVFQPLDPASTYFQEVDKFQKGLQSRYTTLKALGVNNVWDELERIKIEKQGEAEHENNMAIARQGKLPQQTNASSLVDQLKALGPIAHSIKPGDQTTQGAAPGAADQRKDKRDLSKTLAKPGVGGITQPASEGAVAETPAMAEPDMNIQDILAKLKLAQNMTGRGAISGDLLEKGTGQKGTILLDSLEDVNAVKAALGAHANKFDFQKVDPLKPFPSNAAIFTAPQGSKKKSTVHRTQGTLILAVLKKERTNNAFVYTVGIKDAKGQIVPVGKTEPQRSIQPEQGELVKVRVGSISFRDGVWNLSMISPIGTKDLTAPSSVKDVQRLYEAGND